MLVVIPPMPLPVPMAGPVVFTAGSIDLGKSVDWQSALAESLADCPGTMLNPRRAAWDASWKAEATFAPFREQVQWELAGMEAGIPTVPSLEDLGHAIRQFVAAAGARL